MRGSRRCWRSGRSGGRPAGAGRGRRRRPACASAVREPGSGRARRRDRACRAVQAAAGAVSRIVLGHQWRKGGRGAGRTIASELVYELSEGVGGVAEPLGGILLRQAVDEDGAEGFVLSLGGAGGMFEEELAEGVVHARGSECEVFVAVDGL